MKTYKPKAIVSKYYMVLFTLPKWQILVFVFMVISILLVILLGEISIPLLVNSLLVTLFYKIYAELSEETIFYKWKRIVGLSLAILVYTVVFTIATGSSLIAVVSSTTLLIVVTLGLDGTAVSKYVLSTLPPMFTLGLSYSINFYSRQDVVIGVFTIFILVMVDALMYIYMSRRKILNYTFPELGTLFLQNWLDRRTNIEKAFDEIGEVQYVNPRLVELGDLVLVYTDVHYGPFSNIGSSTLPDVLIEVFRDVGVNNIISLHGLGSHDRNIVSSVYKDKFINELVKTYINSEKTELYYHGAFKLEHKKWNLLGIVFDKLSFIIVSRPGSGIDDLPYEIQLEFELKSRSMGLHDLIILDSHNWELTEKLDLNGLREALDMALDEIKKHKSRTPVKVRYRYQCFETIAPGLVNGYGCIACITGDNREEVCVIYLRGNNMKPGVRDLVLQKASILNTDLIEVITNDEHSETGTRSHIVYIPIHDSPELLETIENNCSLITRKPYSEVAWLYNCRMDLKLMGDSIDYIIKELSISVKETAILLFTYVFLTPFVIYAFLRIM
ncbi:MAG: DUF2070 family protein [Desulfurococcaceae archaeon]